MSGLLVALTLLLACDAAGSRRDGGAAPAGSPTVGPTLTAAAGTAMPASPATSALTSTVGSAEPLNFAISANFAPAGSGDVAPSILVDDYELFVMGRVTTFLPARWTTPDGARPADPRALLPGHVAIVTPVVIDLEGKPLVNRAGADLSGGRVVIAAYGGHVGDDRVGSNLPDEQFALGERVLVTLTARPLIWEPAGPLPTEAGPAWRVGMKWTLTDDGQAVSYWQTWQAADLIAAIQAAIGAPATPAADSPTPAATTVEETLPAACFAPAPSRPDVIYQGVTLPQPA